MPHAYILSESDLKILKEFLRVHGSKPKNTGKPSSKEEDYVTPEVHVAETPSGGISGRDNLTPSYAECTIYRVILSNADGTTPTLESQVRTQIVYNLSESGIPGGVLLLVARDKFGSWFASGYFEDADLDTGTGFSIHPAGTGTSPLTIPTVFSGAKVYRCSSSQIIDAGSSAPIDWSLEEYDTDGYHSGTTSRFTIPVSGIYQVGYHLQLVWLNYTISDGSLMSVSLSLNGTSPLVGEVYDTDFCEVATQCDVINFHRVVTRHFNAGDYVEVYVNNNFSTMQVSPNCGTTQAGQLGETNCAFWIHKLADGGVSPSPCTDTDTGTATDTGTGSITETGTGSEAGVTTPCCGTAIIPTVLNISDGSGCTCFTNTVLTYNAVGPNGAGWYSVPIDCGGGFSLTFVMRCVTGAMVLYAFCNGIADGSSSTIFFSCNPFSVSFAIGHGVNCCGGNLVNYTVTE